MTTIKEQIANLKQIKESTNDESLKSKIQDKINALKGSKIIEK